MPRGAKGCLGSAGGRNIWAGYFKLEVSEREQALFGHSHLALCKCFHGGLVKAGAFDDKI